MGMDDDDYQDNIILTELLSPDSDVSNVTLTSSPVIYFAIIFI